MYINIIIIITKIFISLAFVVVVVVDILNYFILYIISFYVLYASFISSLNVFFFSSLAVVFK